MLNKLDANIVLHASVKNIPKITAISTQNLSEVSVPTNVHLWQKLWSDRLFFPPHHCINKSLHNIRLSEVIHLNHVRFISHGARTLIISPSNLSFQKNSCSFCKEQREDYRIWYIYKRCPLETSNIAEQERVGMRFSPYHNLEGKVPQFYSRKHFNNTIEHNLIPFTVIFFI